MMRFIRASLAEGKVAAENSLCCRESPKGLGM